MKSLQLGCKIKVQRDTLKYGCEHHETNLHRPSLTVIVPLSVPLFLRLVSRSLCSSNVSGWGGCHGSRIPIRGPHAVSGFQKKNSPHWSPWQHTSSGSSSFLRHWSLSLIASPSPSSLTYSSNQHTPSHFLISRPSLILLCVCVCLPVCALESSPGPGRQSCPLRCGTLP